jgi:thiosulfate/3-mercaptopyruvate sulfurtransferase
MSPEYVLPGALVSTDWVTQHLDDPSITIVEVDVDTAAYDLGHIPGAVGWNWRTQLCDPLVRDIATREAWETLLGDSGIDNETMVILYGDTNNWFAAWAFWQLKVYGHRDARIVDGGRRKWVAEGRPLAVDAPNVTVKTYVAKGPDNSIRAFLPEVQTALGQERIRLVDVRSPEEFSGEMLAPPGLPETCQRGGHIPGATNVPWDRVCRIDGVSRRPDELRQLYESLGVTPETSVITYCRIGERSSHTWFVLKCLLGYPNVKNYDGSWTEWGNLVGAPIDKPYVHAT